jgi:hypothetical protein
MHNSILICDPVRKKELHGSKLPTPTQTHKSLGNVQKYYIQIQVLNAIESQLLNLIVDR